MTQLVCLSVLDKKSGAPHVVEVEDPRHRGMVAMDSTFKNYIHLL